MQHRQSLLFFFALIFSFFRVDAQTVADTNKTFEMTATFYSDKFVGRKTSSGEVFKQDLYTAAHKSIKLGTLVLVTNPKNGHQVIVKVNDRCPRSGILDLTKKAAKSLGIGSSKVTVRVLPDRWKTIWEHQSKYQKEMENGTLLTLDPHKQGVDIAPIPPTQHIQPGDTLYDLELCTANTRSDAQKILDRLPMHYQSIAELVPSNKSLMVKVKLTLLMKKANAEAVRKELELEYPKSRLIPAKVS